MSLEGEKINLCALKMDETLNLWGRTACIILPASVMSTGLLALVNARSSLPLCVCVFTHFRLHHYLGVWAHEPQSCCRASSISCPLLTSIHISAPTHLPPLGSPPSLFLVHCSQQWLTSVTSSWAGSRRRPGEKWTSRECCVSASRDKVGFNLHQWVWLGVDGEGRVCCRLHKTLGVC